MTSPACDGGDLADAEPIADPLQGLMPPAIGGTAVPNPPAAPVVVSGAVDTGNTKFKQCPQQSRAGTANAPKTCNLEPGADGTNVVRLFPGIYYGGIAIKQTNAAQHLVVYLEPGIYYMAGGGFTVSGDVDIYTVDKDGTTYGGATTSGVMIFNSHNPKDFATCQAGGGGAACAGVFDMDNTGGIVKIRGYSGPVYTSLILFQDRRLTNQTNLPVKLTGNASMTIEGTFYLPEAAFEYAGNGTGEVLNAQVICETFKVSGGGTLTVTYDPDKALQLSGIGLVE